MKKFWILPVTAMMISCGAATEEVPAAAPVEEVAPVEEAAPVVDSTMEEAAPVVDSTMEEAAIEEGNDGHDH